MADFLYAILGIVFLIILGFLAFFVLKILYKIILFCIKTSKKYKLISKTRYVIKKIRKEIIPKILIQSKKITFNVGKTLIDIIWSITPIVCLITLIIGIVKCFSDNFYDSDYPIWILNSIIGFIVISFINYLLYIFIDIRDSLKQIAENITKKD